MTIEGTATWIHSGSVSLHGWVHSPPSGRAAGAVLIAPPHGREQVSSYRALRVLAMMLAEQGWVAIRFGWSGTGDSEELPSTSATVHQWRLDVASMADFARKLTGNQIVHAIGLRLGGSLLALDSTPNIATRILWEPVSGRKFIHTHAALRRMGVPNDTVPAHEGVELGGSFLTKDQADDLRSIPEPGTKAPLPAGAVIVTETDRRLAHQLYVAVPLFARVPKTALQKLIDLLPRSQARHVLPQWEPTTTTVLHADNVDRRVIEEIVSIGPQRIPGLYTRAFPKEPVLPVTGGGTGIKAAAGSHAALLVAASAEPKDGVTALWVAAARRLAWGGVPALRAERIGCGDMGSRHDLQDTNPYTQDIIDGVAQSAVWLAERSGLPVVGIGLCAGAWNLAAAAEAGTMERVVMFNNPAWRNDLGFWARVYSAIGDDDSGGDITDPGEQLAEQRPGAKELIKRLLRGPGPYWLWLLLSRRGRTNAPETVLEKASRASHVVLHLGPDDEAIFIRDRGRRGLARLVRKGRRITVAVHVELDHALLSETARRKTLELIQAELGAPAAVTGDVLSSTAGSR